MKDWIERHLKAAAEVKISASKKEENALLSDVIKVLTSLVKYGYYDSIDDIQTLLPHLLDILNGFTDLCAPDMGKCLVIKFSRKMSQYVAYAADYLPIHIIDHVPADYRPPLGLCQRTQNQSTEWA